MERTGFEKLRVYQLAEELADVIWKMANGWNFLAQNTVGKQMIRAADSVGANIAEGLGRGTSAEAKRFGKIARGSLFELKHWLRRAYSRGLMSEQQVKSSRELINELTPKISAYINSIGNNRPQPTTQKRQQTTHNPQQSVSTTKKTLVICMMCFWILSSSLPASAAPTVDTAQADFIPWSGYWWPFNNGGLSTGQDYRGHPAPIEKYELYTKGSYPSTATIWDRNNHYDTSVPQWYGLCYAYSSAAVMEDIDFATSVNGDVIFYVGDKKGLIVACHDDDVRDLANGTYPETFHYWLLHYIKDNGLAFAGELDPGEQFWSFPIYKYYMEIVEGIDKLSVSCYIWYADDAVHPDFQGTLPLSKRYTYDLSLNALGEITGGQWTGASVADQPGLLWRPVTQRAANPYLDYDIIREIAESSDDEFEATGPVMLPPGTHNLVLQDEDQYEIPCAEGDTLLLRLQNYDTSGTAITCTILDRNGAVVRTIAVESEEELSFVAQSSPYTLRVTKASYANSTVYSIALELVKAYAFVIPRIQKGSAWMGIALTNSDDQTCENVCVVGYREDGEVLTTLAGPLSLSPGEKRMFLLSALSLTRAQQSSLYAIKVIADSPLAVVGLNGTQGRNLSCITGAGSQGVSRFIIPNFSSVSSSTRLLWWGISNQTTRALDVDLTLYSGEGVFVQARSATVPALNFLNYTGSQGPFGGTVENGWVLVDGGTGGGIGGYGRWFMNSYNAAEHLFALEKTGNEFFVPHGANAGEWKTGVTLINLSDQANMVYITLHWAGGAEQTGVQLNAHEQRTTYLAALFPGLDQGAFPSSSLSLESQGEMTGFYSHESSSSQAYFPLMTGEKVQSELIVPHVASNGSWWTGVGVYNPAAQGVSYRIIPYDTGRSVMTDQIKEGSLDGREKEVFLVEQVFDQSRLGSVSFLKVEVDQGPGVAGFYLYGDRTNKVLSGGVMEGVEQ